MTGFPSGTPHGTDGADGGGPDRPENVVDVVASYHRGVAGELAAVRADVDADAGADVAASVERIVTQIVGVLVAEEQYVLPLVREVVPDGDASADTQFERHRALEHQLRRLEDLEFSPETLAPVLADVETRWRALTDYLDVEAMPVVARAVPAERLGRLGDDVLGAIQAAPTRPREVAPRSPTVSKIVGLAEGFVDRARDAWSGRGRGADDVDDVDR